MINKPQVLGKDLNVYSISTNDNSPGNESDIIAISSQAASRNRDVKAIKPIVLRSWLVSNFLNSSVSSIQTNSCITNIESSETFSLKFLRNSQTAYIKNTRTYGSVATNVRNIITVTILKLDNTVLKTILINPKCSYMVSLDSNNNLKVSTQTSCLYPIYSIYYSFDKNNPSNVFPGTTWELQPANCFIYTANGFTQTLAGEDTHVLQPSEIPNHTHSFYHYHNWTQFRDNGNPDTWNRGSGNEARRYMYRSQTQRSEANRIYYDHWKVDTTWSYPTMSYVGSSSAHENTPQFFKAYCWRRMS